MIVYICDRKACGEVCPNPDCKHTFNIDHAKNFTLIDGEYWEIDYERERNEERKEEKKAESKV